MTGPVLHLDFLNLTPEASLEGRRQLEAAARELYSIDGVQEIGFLDSDGGSDFDVALWFKLRDFAALEPFGTSPEYTRFLQGTVAPLIRGEARVLGT